MSKELFDVLVQTKEAVYDKLNEDDKRYIDRQILERRLEGLHLDEETRKKTKAIKEKISDLQIEFSKNCNEESTKLNFTLEQLIGVNENMLNSLPKNENGEFVVSLKYPVYFPIMKECRVPETRRKLLIAFDKRCVNENTKILEEILELRAELANLLGYKNFSEYTLTLLCAKNPGNVNSFLDKLGDKLRVLQLKEMEILLEYKRKECEELNIPFNGKINASDFRYYLNMRDLKEFKIDHAKLQEYFPLDVVINGTFHIYQLLLNLKFEEIANVPSYHEEVRLFQVKDQQTQEIIGHFYTDLHPRDGKYGHAAVFGIQKGCSIGSQKPICMMVCNFTKPTETQPSLLTHDEVETFFHEFGHVMHQICTKASYYKFGGTSVERDFVEAPSQMLENFVWEKESLRLMSRHYKDSSPISDEILDDLIRSKNSADGCLNMRQVLFSTMDQHFHTNPKSNTAKIYQEYVKKFMLYEVEDEECNMNASFEHITGGYEAQYYSYLWSEVYSQDMFDSRFKKDGILNPATGLDYRRHILEPGGSKDANQMVSNFLGREPNEKAFLKSKGIQLD